MFLSCATELLKDFMICYEKKTYTMILPVLVAMQSKVQVCVCSPADIVDANPTGSMDVLSLASVACC